MATANHTDTDARPRVLLTRRIPSSTLSMLEAGSRVELADLATGSLRLTEAQIASRLADKSGLVCVLTDPITSGVLSAAPDLKVVANIAVGYENIDVAAARARGIVVTNTPDVLTEATAELTWALILAVARRVAEGDRLVRRGAWKGWTLDFMLGTELRGKQLGIIGRGRIGRAVAAKAPAFGMRAVFAGRAQGSGRASTAPADDELSLDELLVSSDVVSIHAPMTPANRHMIDRRALARMKRTAFLVNTARGPIVDEEALAWALQERLIAGAGLDVYEREPEVHPALRDIEHVVLVPHLGSATRETRTAMIELAIRNVLAVLGGRPPLTPVASPR